MLRPTNSPLISKNLLVNKKLRYICKKGTAYKNENRHNEYKHSHPLDLGNFWVQERVVEATCTLKMLKKSAMIHSKMLPHNMPRSQSVLIEPTISSLSTINNKKHCVRDFCTLKTSEAEATSLVEYMENPCLKVAMTLGKRISYIIPFSLIKMRHRGEYDFLKS